MKSILATPPQKTGDPQVEGDVVQVQIGIDFGLDLKKSLKSENS